MQSQQTPYYMQGALGMPTWIDMRAEEQIA
jgi:hypothetical protein